MEHKLIYAGNLHDYEEIVENLKLAGFELKDQTIEWDLWESENDRFFVRKDF
ncbi:MAG: hypothetical protein IKU47_07200 [Oscillospiraceae bacterium]|nr:hypothetical protein [Oscillospiraceae bacterium]